MYQSRRLLGAYCVRHAEPRASSAGLNHKAPRAGKWIGSAVSQGVGGRGGGDTGSAGLGTRAAPFG